MRVLFGLLIASLLVVVTSGLITHKHVGALNHRLVKNKQSSVLSSQVSSLPEQWFTQVLDHFDGTNPSTWQQRYFVNDTFWTKPDGPVFIMLGGEGPISPAYVNGHFIVNDYAAEHGALIVAVEHRFYGKSVPGNNSQVSNLRFLSSQQALADVAVFHDHINSQYGVSNTAKWVSFGGSYSGSLSAWLRAKYPHLIYASFAASAPILAQLDFPQYFEVVSRSIGATCSNKIRNGYAQVLSLLESAQGKQKLQQLFNTCTPIVSENDVIQFLGAISNGFAGVVQYNDDNVGYEPFDITTLCQKLESIADDLQALAEITLLYTADTTGPICMEVSYQQFLKDMTPTSDGRSWTYQTCTEFGYYQTGEASDQPFPPAISLASFLSQCVDIFGIPDFTPHISFTNEYYGGKNIITSNTVFTNGNVDPWHILGLTKREPGLQDKTAVIYMNGTAHCADLYPPRAADVPDLTRAREIQRSFLNAWLGGEDVARKVVMLS